MSVETIAFDPDRYFTAETAQLQLLEEALASGDAGCVADAIGVIARNRGMGEIAAQSGLNRPALYAALSSGGNPTLDTLLKVLAALGLELAVRPRQAA